MYNVNDRIKVDNYIGTIRYVGMIDEWGGILTLGIEWDDPSRGRNDGMSGNKQYFKPKNKGSGSFIKVSNKKICKRLGFNEALMETYGIEDNEITETIKFGSKVAENYGFEKLNQINSVYDELTSVSLDNKCIYKYESAPLSSVKNLDLSFNLFSDLDQVWNIIDQYPQLQQLNLNGNRFQNFPSGFGIHNLISLKLATTELSIDDLNGLLRKFPCLQELVIASNHYNDDDISCLEVPSTLKYIDLSFNDLTKVPNLHADSLNVSDNKIKEFEGIYSIKDIDLRYNLIDSWNFIDGLYENFKLNRLRINGNPIFNNMDDEEMDINLISRLDSQILTHLNGSILTPDQITNAELYFISKVKTGTVELNTFKWQQLKEKYNVADVIQQDKYNKMYYKKMRISVFWNDQIVLERDVLEDYSILRIKGLASQKLKMSILKIRLYYYLNGSFKQYLDQDISRLQDFSFDPHQQFYIEA